MTALALALDLGTGGCKASVWDESGRCLAETVADYPTAHPRPGWNEQRPSHWWDAVLTSVAALLQGDPSVADRLVGLAVSGHSLGAVMLDTDGEVIGDTTPIWSDTRAQQQAEEFFTRVEEERWYTATGNGFTPCLYPLFTAMWFAEHRAQEWSRTASVVGCKDWLNLRLTGRLATDASYASGSGCFDIATGDYDAEFLRAAGVERSVWPDIVGSTELVGRVTAAAAGTTGLPEGLPVFAGGVDNACMALGSRGVAEGSGYASLGSSSWVSVVSREPVLDVVARPFVFAHVVPDLWVSALSTFSSGTTLEWLRTLVAPGVAVADLLEEGCAAPVGAEGLLCLPMLSGGTPLEGGSAVRGALQGLDLGHGRGHLVRAVLEGVALSLRRGLAVVDTDSRGEPEPLLVSGGGSRHPGWNQIYADVFDRELVRTAVDQQAAAWGAASIAFVGSGVWQDFGPALAPHRVLDTVRPDPDTVVRYRAVAGRFDAALAAVVSASRRLATTSPAVAPATRDGR